MTHLIQKLYEERYAIWNFTSDNLYVGERELSDYVDDLSKVEPLLFQTGYLTVRNRDEESGDYLLTYPNNEVKYAFVEALMPIYLQQEGVNSALDIRSFGRDIEEGNIEGFMKRIDALFAGIPYPTNNKILEWNFQSIVYILFTLMGKRTRAEVQTAVGRIDCYLETKKCIYIFEFKIDDSAENALLQINDRRYAAPYAMDHRRIRKIGVSFSTETRSVKDWKEE